MKTLATIPLTLLVLAALSLPAAGLAKGGKGKDKKAPDGGKLFSSNCAYCHGNGGRGDGPNAAKLSPAPADLTKIRSGAAEISGVVKNGKGSCPSWRASLSDEEITAVAAWAQSLQR